MRNNKRSYKSCDSRDRFGGFDRFDKLWMMDKFAFGPEMTGNLRAKRGSIEPSILSALIDKPMHGYEIISHLEEKSGGIWRPSPGSVYPTLQMLEEKGDIVAEDRAGKKVYHLTDSGRESAEQVTDDDSYESWEQRVNSAHEQHRFFHREVGEVFRMMRQIFRGGSRAQKLQFYHALGQFRARLEQIIEEEEE